MAFNLDAELGLPFVFTFGGEEFSMPPDVDFATIEKLKEGNPDAAMGLLLGAEQVARLEALPGVFGARAFKLTLDAYFEHLGIRQGESSGSASSSTSTAEPSKPTSSGTTALRLPTSRQVA
jgi:hypothetical protein